MTAGLRLTLLLAATGMMAVLSACASDAPHGPPPGDFDGGDRGEQPGEHGHGGPGGMRQRLNIFISPMGEPFRGEPDEAYPVARWFAQADVDHDGHLTEAEFTKDADRFFDKLDANHDGVIDGFEVSDYERIIAPEIQPRIESLHAGEGMDMSLGKSGRGGGRRGPPEGGEGGGGRGREALAGDLARQGAGLYSMLTDPEPVASASTELNGRISRAEWRAAAHRRFVRLDVTGRGWLSLADLPKTPVQQVLERRAARDKRHPPPKP